MANKINRRQSRETAFALLFEWSFHEYSVEDMISSATTARDLEVDNFARELAGRTIEYYLQLDRLIEKHSANWKLSRISRVALAALRIAFCELEYFDDIPQGVTINEAVELVKKYGAEEESAYINGILGGYTRTERTEEEL